MDEENKSVEGAKDKETCSSDEELSHPKLSKKEWVAVIIGCIFLVSALLYVVEQFCSIHILTWLPDSWLAGCRPFLQRIFSPCVWGTYIAFGVVLIVLLIFCVICHRFSVQRARLEDRSVVDAMIVEAETVEPRLTKPEIKPENFDKKTKDLKKETNRLKEMGSREWTEYQVLSLNQMLVDFLKVDDLIASARLSLTELEDYAEDSARQYDWQQCYRWQDKIEGAIKKIEQVDPDDPQIAVKRDEAAEQLRAELRMLLEQIASYNLSWAEGSAIVRGIIRCGVLAIFPLVAMGLLPLLHPEGSKILVVLNWGLLGVSGSVTAVLLSLRKSDFVEVGNTQGKKELWRAVLSTALGLVAGILFYSMMAGGIFSGTALPNFTSEQPAPKDIALSIFWAIAAGYCFELVLDLIRSNVQGLN